MMKKRFVMIIKESAYEEVMEELKDLNFEDLGVVIERVSDTEFDLHIIKDTENPCKDIKDLDCQYEGCEKTMIGFESRFGCRYCEDHREVPPSQWKHKDNRVQGVL